MSEAQKGVRVLGMPGALRSDNGHVADPVLHIEQLAVVHSKLGRKGVGHAAVDGVDLRVDAGEIVGVVGESGSGKTSLAMAVAGLGRHSGGTIDVNGVDPSARRMSLAERASIQVVFQDPHGSLDPRQTIGKGLRELRRLHGVRTDWVTDAELMERVGLHEEVLDRLPHQISGGQAQRVSIARAVLLRPNLLLADEPTSALDVSVQAQILQMLLRLRDEENLTILFISHDLAVVRAVCDRVYVMKSGKVVEEGRVDDVLERPRHPYTRALIEAVPGASQEAV